MKRKPNITYPSGLILEALASGIGHGFDIMDATGLPDGTVYPALRRLEAAGMVTGCWEDAAEAYESGRPRRRYYQLTPEGQLMLAEARTRFRGLPSAIAQGRA